VWRAKALALLNIYLAQARRSEEAQLKPKAPEIRRSHARLSKGKRQPPTGE